MARRNSAARRVFVEVGNRGNCQGGDCPYFLGSAGLRRLPLRVMLHGYVALTKVQTLRF